MPHTKALTIDSLLEGMRQLEMTQMDAEMEILLKDNGPAILSLLHGGKLVEVDGKYYVVAKEVFETGYCFNPQNPFARPAPSNLEPSLSAATDAPYHPPPSATHHPPESPDSQDTDPAPRPPDSPPAG